MPGHGTALGEASAGLLLFCIFSGQTSYIPGTSSSISTHNSESSLPFHPLPISVFPAEFWMALSKCISVTSNSAHPKWTSLSVPFSPYTLLFPSLCLTQWHYLSKLQALGSSPPLPPSSFLQVDPSLGPAEITCCLLSCCLFHSLPTSHLNFALAFLLTSLSLVSPNPTWPPHCQLLS